MVDEECLATCFITFFHILALVAGIERVEIPGDPHESEIKVKFF